MTQSDNTNFFDDLEHQLVAATSDRPRRLRRARRRAIATMCTILVAVLAVGGGLAVALSNSTNNDAGAPAGRRAPQTTPTAATTPAVASSCGRHTKAASGVPLLDPRSIEVAVLNGTSVPGLARGVANRLQNTHFKIGTVTNAPAQDRTQTTVYYSRPACKAAATVVGQAIDLANLIGATKPMRTTVAIVAGGSADVVVVVGSDQNQTR